MKKDPKRILALAAVVLLAAVCCLPMIAAFGKGERSAGFFRLSIGLVIAVPIFAYICMMAAKLWGSRKEQNMGTIRNVIFDVGNVLLEYNWSDYLDSFGFPEEKRERIANATFLSETWNLRDKGGLPDEEYMRQFVANAPEYEEEIREVVAGTRKCLHNVDYAIPWIRFLKSKGYRLFVLSNYSSAVLAETRDMMDFLPYMDGVVFSCEVNQLKPEPEIYRTLMDRYGLAAEECVFLDDREENCEGARKLGIKAICFQNFTQAAKALEELGVA